MSLCFTAPGGSLEQRWIVYALLRDNVQHYLESGRRSGAFEALHGVAAALGGRRVVIDACKLRTELEQARSTLMGRPISDLAVSRQTQAVLDWTWPPPQDDGTSLLGPARATTIPWLSSELKTLDQAFGHLIDGLLDITAGADRGAVVEVLDL